jgi:hypothetical protein
MRAPKFITEEGNKWSEYVMAQFIIFQNSYSYDGNPPIKHSAESLASFCEMTDELKLKKFNKVYNRIYRDKDARFLSEITRL